MLDLVQLPDPETVTLARCLGEPTHRSLQQRKLERRGISTTEELVALAVQRGCTQYQNGIQIPVIPESDLSNESLAALMLSASQPYAWSFSVAAPWLWALSRPCRRGANSGNRGSAEPIRKSQGVDKKLLSRLDLESLIQMTRGTAQALTQALTLAQALAKRL